MARWHVIWKVITLLVERVNFCVLFLCAFTLSPISLRQKLDQRLIVKLFSMYVTYESESYSYVGLAIFEGGVENVMLQLLDCFVLRNQSIFRWSCLTWKCLPICALPYKLKVRDISDVQIVFQQRQRANVLCSKFGSATAADAPIIFIFFLVEEVALLRCRRGMIRSIRLHLNGSIVVAF